MVFVGKKYELMPDTRAYPRYHFFRSKLKDLFNRVDNVLEKNQLPDLVTQGKQTWFYIQHTVRTCLNQSGKVSIHMFASNVTHIGDIKPDLIRNMLIFDGGKMSKLLPEIVEERSEDWQSFVTAGVKEFSPQVIVYVKGQQEPGSIVETQMRVLPQIEQDRLVIYDTNNKTSYLYKSPDQDTKRLCLNVEFLLERNVIQLLELIEDFVGKFIPGGVDRDLSSNDVKEKIVTQLQESLNNTNVLNDFIPVSTDEDQYSEELKAEKSVLSGDKKQEAIFWIKIRSFMSRKVKCEFCDLTAKRLGIRGTFLNEFLSDNFFGFEKKFQGKITSNVLPRWPLQSAIERMFRSTSYFCRTVCNEVLAEAEKYLGNMYAVLRGFQKDQFEIRGLLRRSPRAVSREVPRVQRISRSLQNAILDVDNVEACGNLYGTLTVIVNKQLTAEQRTEIKNIIKNHRHAALYDIAITDGWNQQTPFVAPGNGIVCEFIPGGREKLLAKLKEESKELSENVKGTLGCFVEPVTGSDLYGVTCNHCVDKEYFHQNVKAIFGQGEIEFGTRSFSRYHPYTLDVALVRVNENMKPYCVKHLPKADGMMRVANWKFSNKNEIELEQFHVYKSGLASGLTSGIVAGAEFKTKHMKKLEDKGFGLKTTDGENIEVFNIFVDGSGEEGFSKGGDSGSAVCIEEISNDAAQESTVEVISLLCGDITLEETEEPSAGTSTAANAGIQPTGRKKTYSYSCHMRKLLHALRQENPQCPPLKEAIHKE